VSFALPDVLCTMIGELSEVMFAMQERKQMTLTKLPSWRALKVIES
jgi:hypothetical protein